MKNRSPLAVLLLPFVTFGIYTLYWEVKTKGEMNTLGADIPTAWLIIVPFVNIWWMWKYSKGVEHVTNQKLNAALVFIGFWLIGFIMSAIVQDAFNEVGGSAPAAAAAPATAPVETAAPAATQVPVSEPAAPTETPPTPPVVQ